LLSGYLHFKTKALKIGLAIFHVALIFYCTLSLGRRWNAASSRLFWGAFLFRLVAGISLGLVYIYYYAAGDTWQFFEDAKKFSALAREDLFSYLKALFDFSENQFVIGELVNRDLRSVFFIKIISVFCLLSLDNYWVCSAYFSLLAFISSWGLHRKIVSIYPDSQTASALGFLLFPSVIFWSSGLEKESMALCGIYFLTILFLTLMSSKKPSKLFCILIVPVGFVIWSLKYYWAVVFFISISTALLMRLLLFKFPLIKKFSTVVWIILFLGIGVVLSFTHPNFYLSRFLEVIVSNNGEFEAISDPGNLIHYYQFEQSWTSIMINSPWALISGLFRPQIGEGQGLLGWAASIENFFLLVLFVGALLNFKKGFAFSQLVILSAALSYCIVLCVFLALSTPNFGTLSRYRVGFLPFFVFVTAYRNPIVVWLSIKLNQPLTSISIFGKNPIP
jgi:hypothetical protein